MTPGLTLLCTDHALDSAHFSNYDSAQDSAVNTCYSQADTAVNTPYYTADAAVYTTFNILMVL